MPFETGEPSAGAELTQRLSALVSEGTAYLAPWSDADFFAPQGTAWSPAEHLRHLRKSSAAVVAGLRLPRLFLAMRFGLHVGPSRSFTALREEYRGALAAGGRAGRFTPATEPPARDPRERRNTILSAWTAAAVALNAEASRWSEAGLDRYQLPHPLLGKLTLREMLMFTVYHTAHHLRRIAERRGG